MNINSKTKVFIVRAEQHKINRQNDEFFTSTKTETTQECQFFPFCTHHDATQLNKRLTSSHHSLDKDHTHTHRHLTIHTKFLIQ